MWRQKHDVSPKWREDTFFHRTTVHSKSGKIFFFSSIKTPINEYNVTEKKRLRCNERDERERRSDNPSDKVMTCVFRNFRDKRITSRCFKLIYSVLTFYYLFPIIWFLCDYSRINYFSCIYYNQQRVLSFISFYAAYFSVFFFFYFAIVTLHIALTLIMTRKNRYVELKRVSSAHIFSSFWEIRFEWKTCSVRAAFDRIK